MPTSNPPLADLPTLPTRFVGAKLVPQLTLADSGFLFNARDGETYSLNPSGAHLLAALQTGTTPAELWQRLVERFAIPPQLAQRDAQLFLAHLFDLGLLEIGGEA